MPESTEAGVTKKTGFGETEIERRAETAATAAAASARAVIEAQYVMAMRNPRDWDQVRLRILAECDRTAFAREAIYHKPIGAGVTGLSIRFAEVAVRCMGNMAIPTTTTFDDDTKRIVCQSVVDLESNVHYSRDVTINKTVERQSLRDGQVALSRRANSRGQLIYIVAASEDDLLNKEGALVSKALRTLVLRLLPGDIQAEARARVGATMKKEIASDPEGQKKAILDAFYQRGVKPADVKEFLGHDMAAITPDEIATLRNLHNAIRDGEANMKDAIADAKEKRGEKPTEGEGKQEQPPPTSATQAVSRQAAETLKKARESAPTDAQGREPVEQRADEEAAPQGKPGPGRPANCPGFGGKPCPDDNKLRTPEEKGFKLCEACRARRASGEQKEEKPPELPPSDLSALDASDPTPDQVAAFQGDPLVKLAWKVRVNFTLDTGNLAQAEIKLSELSGGKVQRFSTLPDYLRTWPEFIEKLQEAMR